MSDEDHFIKWFKQVNAKIADAPNCPDSLREQLRGAVVILKSPMPPYEHYAATLTGEVSVEKAEDEEETPK